MVKGLSIFGWNKTIRRQTPTPILVSSAPQPAKNKPALLGSVEICKKISCFIRSHSAIEQADKRKTK